MFPHLLQRKRNRNEGREDRWPTSSYPLPYSRQNQMIKLMELCLRWKTFDYNCHFIYFSLQVSELGGKMVEEEEESSWRFGRNWGWSAIKKNAVKKVRWRKCGEGSAAWSWEELTRFTMEQVQAKLVHVWLAWTPWATSWSWWWGRLVRPARTWRGWWLRWRSRGCSTCLGRRGDLWQTAGAAWWLASTAATSQCYLSRCRQPACCPGLVTLARGEGRRRAGGGRWWCKRRGRGWRLWRTTQRTWGEGGGDWSRLSWLINSIA